jgi:antirestriction protein ArdC
MLTKSVKPASDKYEIVSERLIELLEKGVKPWSKPWSAIGYQNLLTNHQYTGINPLLCAIDCLLNDWEQPYFLTFAQAKAQQWQVKKGSKSTWIKWGGTYAIEGENEQGETTTSFKNAAKWFNVFNISCIDDSQSKQKIADLISIAPSKTEFKPIETLENLIQQTGAKISYRGDRAFYHPATDQIKLPNRTDFKTSAGFYSTAIHELGHWTGHSSRLNRPMCGQFGSQSYAYEELIAELTAAFIGNDYGLSAELENHASYLESWLKALKDDKKYFFKAAGEARKASQFLLEN